MPNFLMLHDLMRTAINKQTAVQCKNSGFDFMI